MELKLVRSTKTEESTIGELSVNGEFECYILEDVDRGLKQEMPLEEIKAIKIYGKTAIPSGRYEIAITFSNRFQKYLPLLLNVKGFEGIRIHPLNVASESDGCLGPGEAKAINKIINSRKAFTKLFNKMKEVERKEKIYLTIE